MAQKEKAMKTKDTRGNLAVQYLSREARRAKVRAGAHRRFGELFEFALENGVAGIAELGRIVGCGKLKVFRVRGMTLHDCGAARAAVRRWSEERARLARERMRADILGLRNINRKVRV